MFLTLCPYSSPSGLYHSSFFLAHSFIFFILIFSVVKKLIDFSFFLDFHCLWFAIDFIQVQANTESCLESIFQNFRLLLFIAFFLGLGIVFKRFFAFEFYSVAYVFSVIILIFELV